MCSRGGIHSRNGPHWAALLLETGFLRFVARVQAFPHCLRDLRAEAFTMMLSDEFPQYFGHRFVVTSAVKAARELVRNGDDTNMEVDDMRHAWSTFTNVLLEQTVINTVYERDFAENDLKKCENCKINQQEVNLFKCAGCKSSMYCSKECQKVSWSTGGHRTHCKVLQKSSIQTGTVMPPDSGMFLTFVAISEGRRHMPVPGLSTHLASAETPLGIPAQRRVVHRVLRPPPTQHHRQARARGARHGGRSRARATSRGWCKRGARATARPRCRCLRTGGGSGGAPSSSSSLHAMPRDMHVMAKTGDEELVFFKKNGDAKIPHLLRESAKDEWGRTFRL